MALHTVSVKKTFTLRKAVMEVVPDKVDECSPSEGHYDETLGKIVREEVHHRISRPQSKEEREFDLAQRMLESALEKLRPRPLGLKEKCQEPGCYRYGCSRHLFQPQLPLAVRQTYEHDILVARERVRKARAALRPGVSVSF